MILKLPGSGAVCRVTEPERSGLRWVARVDYAWSWVKAEGHPINGVLVRGWTHTRCRQRAAQAVARFHAHNGPSWEWSPEERAELGRQMRESLGAMA